MLALFVVMAAFLAPPYYENWRFERFLSALAHDKASSSGSLELIQALVVDRAAASGLPVRTGDVHVARLPNGVRIDVLYVVHLDLAVYAIDLHFRPGA